MTLEKRERQSGEVLHREAHHLESSTNRTFLSLFQQAENSPIFSRHTFFHTRNIQGCGTGDGRYDPYSIGQERTAGQRKRPTTRMSNNRKPRQVAIGEGRAPELVCYSPIESLLPRTGYPMLVAVTLGAAAQWRVRMRWEEEGTTFEESQSVSSF